MNHYKTLNLPSPDEVAKEDSRGSITASDIKQAYRLMLLKHHPDKASVAAVSDATGAPRPAVPSIDAIKVAFKILSDPAARSQHDKELILQCGTPRTLGRSKPIFHTGEELVDLDDMHFDDRTGTWFRECRCGERRGFVVTEEQLRGEEESGGREAVLGCRSCSLWLRVTFAVTDASTEAGKAGAE